MSRGKHRRKARSEWARQQRIAWFKRLELRRDRMEQEHKARMEAYFAEKKWEGPIITNETVQGAK